MIANASQNVVERDTMSLKKALLPAAALLLFLLPLVSTAPPFAYTADLRTWRNDWVQVSNCLANHQLPCSHVNKYAPAYLLLSFMIQKLERAGLSANSVLEISKVRAIGEWGMVIGRRSEAERGAGSYGRTNFRKWGVRGANLKRSGCAYDAASGLEKDPAQADRVVVQACKKNGISVTELRSGSRRGKWAFRLPQYRSC